MELAARRCLNEKRIDATAMVAGDDATLVCGQWQFVEPARPPEQLAKQICPEPKQPLKWRQRALAEHYDDRCQDCDAQRQNENRGDQG